MQLDEGKGFGITFGVAPFKRAYNHLIGTCRTLFSSGFGNHPANTSIRFFFWLLSKDEIS
jgi:hypothetical protein